MRKQASLVALVVVSLAPSFASAQAPRETAVYLGIIAGAEDAGGVQVRAVTPGSPADKAGVRMGDLILKINDKDVQDYESLAGALEGRKPGDKVSLQVRRDGKDETLSVTLAQRPEPRTERRFGPVRPLPFERRPVLLGIQMQALTPELKQQLGVGVDQGVVVTEVVPGSPAEKAGLKASDVITHLEAKEVQGPEALREAIQNAGAGKSVTLQVARGKETVELKAKLEETAAPAPVPLPRFARPEGRFPGIDLPPVFEESRRVQELERRVQELEKRLKELEQRLRPVDVPRAEGKPKPPPP